MPRSNARRRRARRRDDDLDAIFAALSDRTRRSFLQRLRRSDATVSELAQPAGISLPAVSRHLKVLEDAGLIGRTIEGRVHHCHLDARTLRAVDRWLESYRRFWEDTLESLAQFVERR